MPGGYIDLELTALCVGHFAFDTRRFSRRRAAEAQIENHFAARVGPDEHSRLAGRRKSGKTGSARHFPGHTFDIGP